MAASICELCGNEMPPHSHYIVRIDVFADPQVPHTTSEELAAGDFDKTVSELLEEMNGMTTEELQDQVHRRFEFKICGKCQRLFLANPLGKPRRDKPGEN